MARRAPHPSDSEGNWAFSVGAIWKCMHISICGKDSLFEWETTAKVLYQQNLEVRCLASDIILWFFLSVILL